MGMISGTPSSWSAEAIFWVCTLDLAWRILRSLSEPKVTPEVRRSCVMTAKRCSWCGDSVLTGV